MTTTKAQLKHEAKALAQTVALSIVQEGIAAPMVAVIEDGEPFLVIILELPPPDSPKAHDVKLATWIGLGRLLAGADGMVHCADVFCQIDPKPGAQRPHADINARDAISLTCFLLNHQEPQELEVMDLLMPYGRDDDGSIVFDNDPPEPATEIGGLILDGLTAGLLAGPLDRDCLVAALSWLGHHPFDPHDL